MGGGVATGDCSLVITNFNKKQFLARAVRSCLNQFLLRKKTEVIVVDDGSDDGSLDTIKEFNDHIKLISLGKNYGVARASNVGLQNSTAEYWMRVDADDYLSAEACFHLTAILDNNKDFDFAYADHYRIDLRGNRLERVRLNTERSLFEHGAGILFRTNTLIELGGYDEDLRNAEDYDLLLRLKQAEKKGYYLPVPLYRYYIHGANITLDESRQHFWDVVEKKHGII